MSSLEPSGAFARLRHFSALTLTREPSCLSPEDARLYHTGGIDRLREAEIRVHAGICESCARLLAEAAPEGDEGPPTLRTDEVNAIGRWGETPGATSEANSTALAVQALLATHRKANPGIRWLVSHQEGCKAKVGRRLDILRFAAL